MQFKKLEMSLMEPVACLLLILKHHFYTNEKPFELFCIKNDFPKCHNVFI